MTRRPAKDFVSPICGSPTPIVRTSMVGPRTCAVQDATVHYCIWPVTRDFAHLCQKKKDTLRRPLSAHQSQEKTTRPKYWGTTLTSPTVYIALDGTWSRASAGTIYHNHSRVLLPQIPTEVSSICGVVGGGFLPQTFNYADLHGPPPASAYLCQPSFVSPQYRPHWVNRTSVD